MKLSWYIPIKTVSEANSSEHWTAKSKRHQQQKFFIQLALKKNIHLVSLPCEVKLIRIGRKLDFANLVCSLKWVEDSVADMLIPGLKPGRADGDPRIKTEFCQEPGKILAIRIEISYDASNKQPLEP